MPGGIDPHTHLEMPFMGTYSADDFESGTRAALSGGTTMVVDFILPGQGQGLMDAAGMWHNKSGRATCDYSYHMAITWWGPSVWDDMEASVKAGITSFKHFMAYKGALMVNDDELFASFRRCGDLGALALVHAENGDVVAELQAKLMAEGNTGPEAHAYSRPPAVEGEATNRAIMIADMAGVPVYIVHTSCEEAHEAIRRARQNGQRVWGEPLIQHLTLDESEYANPDWDHAAQRVMSPPFRDRKHQDSLWAGLQSGSLSVVATDHCAFTTKQKRFGVGDFTKIPNGTGGLEDRLPMLWTHGVVTGRLTMNEFVAVTSTNIAKILNCYPQKGAVLVGADADLVVLDPKASKTITAAKQQSAIDYNVFEGKQVTGLPRFTLTRGQLAVTEGKVTTQEGHGKFVARAPRPAVNRALSAWKDLTAPRPVVRTGVPSSGV
jgi:dihydropyrimidinase